MDGEYHPVFSIFRGRGSFLRIRQTSGINVMKGGLADSKADSGAPKIKIRSSPGRNGDPREKAN